MVNQSTVTVPNSVDKTPKLYVGFTHFDPRFNLMWSIFQYFVRSNADHYSFTLTDAAVTTLADQIRSIDKFIEKEMDVILIKPAVSGDEDLLQAIARAHAKGIPVISLDRAAGGLAACTIGADHIQGQEVLTAHMFRRIQGKGKVAHLQGDLRHESARLRTLGFHNVLKQNPGISLVFENSLDWMSATGRREKACAMAHEALSAHPDICAIVTANDDAALGAMDAIDALGLQGKVLVSGFDALPEVLIAIQDGKIEATARQGLDEMARRAFEIGVDTRNGKAPPAEVLIPVKLITKEVLVDASMYTMQIIPEIMRDLVNRNTEQQVAANFLEAVIDNIPAMLVVKDVKDLSYVRTNRAREKWTDVSAKEQIGKSPYLLYPPEMAERMMRIDGEVVRVWDGQANPEIVDLPEEHSANHQGPRILHTRKIPIFGTNGKVEFLLAISEDITERKEGERALAQHALELEQAYESLKSNQSQLLISEKMASLGRLTAGIAHEMNTPLAAVRASMSELTSLIKEYADSLDDPDVNADDHREIAAEMSAAVKMATSSAERAAGFVRGVKSQTRDLAPQQGVRFNAVALIEDSILLLSHAMRDSKCTVVFTHSAPQLELLGSPARLAQVVTNLVGNAADASKSRGGGEIRVTLAPADDGYLLLEVSDSGGGIPPDILTKIFEPMFTTKPFGEGTGLGLSIVHDVVTGDFKGSVEVRSKVGKGTTFSLKLAIQSTAKVVPDGA